MDERYPKQQGFTLVELIVVILLIAIVSAYAASRYVGVSSFSAYAVQEQAISVIRQIQVNRMQSNLSDSSSNDAFTLSISNDCLGSLEACTLLSDSRSDFIQVDGLEFSPETTISFNLLGNPEGAASGGVAITIQALDSQTQVCINSQGYVSQGECL